MKRIGALFVMGLFLFACATVPKTGLSSNELFLLKGRWEGTRDIIWGRYRAYDHTVMEIYNDTVPLKGQVRVAAMEGTDPRTYDFDNGVVDGEGNLVVQLQEKIKFVLSLFKEEKRMKLDGDYSHGGNLGRLTLYKK